MSGPITPLFLPHAQWTIHHNLWPGRPHSGYTTSTNTSNMAGLENYASRQLGDAFAPPAAGKRSSTPQPQHTWSKQRVNDPIERQPRSKSRDDRGPVRTSAQHAASLKVPVNNTLVTARKPLRTQSVPQNHPAIASVAQHSKSHGPSAQSYQEVSYCSPFPVRQQLICP